MIDNKVFTGKMNMDTDNYRMPQGDYKYALNITRDARGSGQDNVVSNIVGNRLVSTTLASGTNKRIGSRQDLVRNRIYFFVWNSNGYHKILYYDRGTEAIVELLTSKTDSGGVDILTFGPSYRINHVDIIYREDDGDLLFWTDGYNRPKVLNVDEAESNLYGTNWREQYLSVAKYMPLIAPISTYQDDSTYTVNNLRRTLYQFRYRWVYTNNFKSTWSPYGKLIAPANPDDVATEIDPEKNNKISVTVTTGNSDVTAIEIAARSILATNVMSDDSIIATIEKGDTIVSDGIYSYSFYNDGVYPSVTTEESDLLFDYVPKKAFTQAMPNGNVLTYAAITEGITFTFTPDVVASVAAIDYATSEPFTATSYNPPMLFGVTFTGTPLATDVVSVNVTILGLGVYAGNYTIVGGDTVQDIADYFEADINAAFPSGPLFATSFGSGDRWDLTVEDLDAPRGGGTIGGSVYVTYNAVTPTVDAVSNSVYKNNSKYRFGIVHFDDYGVTDGFHTTDEMLVTTTELTTTGGLETDIPSITMKVFNKPPVNAKYFSWVRSLNRTVQTFIPFVSCDVELLGTTYQYIEVTNLQNNKFNYPIYEYTEGDRIRVIGVFAASAAGAVAVWDFPVIGLVVNPTGISAGTYIQIPYSSTATLVATSKYYCEVYTPAIKTDTGTEVLYEFGETYSITNAGTSTRAYSSNRQVQVSQSNNQVSTIVKPATAPSVAVAASAGNLGIGAYYYKITFADVSGNESEASVSSAVATTSGGNQQVNLTAIALGAAGVTSRKIYRTLVGGTIFYLVATIADNTTTIYTDNIADASLTLQMPQPAIFNFTRGDVYLRRRVFPSLADLSANIVTYVVIPSVSDLYPSTVNGNGRAFAEYSEAEQEKYYPTLIRFGREFQQDTTVNELNRFYFDSQDTYDRSNGDVRKLHVEGRALYVFQKFDVGVVPIYTQVVRDTTGNPLEANSDILLNKIQYPYKGKFGIGDVPESFAYYRNAKYFVDPNKGCACRLSQDGITPLSVLYGVNAFFVDTTAAYRKDLNTGIAPTGGVYTGDPTIYGVFDYYTNKYVVAFEEITRYSSPSVESFQQDPYTIVFLESRDEKEGFESFTSFFPEGLESIGTTLVSFKNGQCYVHDSDTFCEFYGQAYPAIVDAVFNANQLIKKTYISLAQLANYVWDNPDITTSMVSRGTVLQSSYINESNYKRLEGMFHANFWRDNNSRLGALNGEQLKGNWIQIRFRNLASYFVTLNMVSLKYINSPLTSN